MHADHMSITHRAGRHAAFGGMQYAPALQALKLVQLFLREHIQLFRLPGIRHTPCPKPASGDPFRGVVAR